MPMQEPGFCSWLEGLLVPAALRFLAVLPVHHETLLSASFRNGGSRKANIYLGQAPWDCECVYAIVQLGFKSQHGLSR